MDKVTSFFEMSGYGVFIWPSYLISAGVLGVLLIASLRLRKTNETALEALRGEKDTLK